MMRKLKPNVDPSRIDSTAETSTVFLYSITFFCIYGATTASFLLSELLAWGSPERPPIWPVLVLGPLIGCLASRQMFYGYPCGHEVREQRPVPGRHPWPKGKVAVLDRVENLLNNPNWGIGRRRVRALKAARLLRKHRSESPEDLRAYFLERERFCLILAGEHAKADKLRA
jgi:hypothetical protein